MQEYNVTSIMQSTFLFTVHMYVPPRFSNNLWLTPIPVALLQTVVHMHTK